MNCENNKELHNRLLNRKPAFTPKEAETTALRNYFNSNPDSLAVYLFFDGHIEDVEAYTRRLINRTAQLVSVAADGFPVLISRGRILGFDSCPLCKAAKNGGN
jgi:prepilin-type processing-associated H-X9-DG protein